MAQKQHVQKPYKVMAEQYFAANEPPPRGVCTLPDTPLYQAGEAHVHTERGIYAPVEGDWIVEDVWYPHAFYIISDAEFSDRFGGTGPALETETRPAL